MTNPGQTIAAAAIAAAAIAVAVGAAGCGEGTSVDVDPVPADYTDWLRVDATGAVPGHGDTYRVIYANEEAQDRLRSGDYPRGSIIVKEIHQRDGDGPGAIDYVAVMRRLESAPDGAELHFPSALADSGWLFTYLADGIDSDEEARPSCWDSCHLAAPFAGTFLDYAR